MEINLSIGFISFVSSALLSLFLLIVYFIGVQNEHKGKPFLLLVLATLIWSMLLIMSQIGASNAFDLIMIAELLRYYTWFYVLQTAAGRQFSISGKISFSDPLSPLNISIFFSIALVIILFNNQLSTFFNISSPISIQIGLMLLLSITGLVVVEQIYRNTAENDRWAINFLCISAGAIFVYDFFVYSNAFLVQTIDYEFWSARGLVNAAIMPALVLAAVRNPKLAPEIHVSRTFVFHSTALLGTGAYLIVMSITGFYIREYSGEWGKVLQAAFLFIALLLLVSLFFSPNIKTRIKRYLNYSFRNKYDYRDEWNRFSQTLLTSDKKESIYQRSLKAIAQIVGSKGATLWLEDNGNYHLKAEFMMRFDHPEIESNDSILIGFIHQNHDLFTRQKFKKSGIIGKDMNHWFLKSQHGWLIIPLWINQLLFGFVELQQPVVEMELNIEDHDLLNTIAHHVALSLSLKETDLALQQAQRFKEVNQITAFLIHDLKTVLSQLTLLVENGKTHKDNPEFIDDMFNTVEHVSQKMKRLVLQLKEPERLPEYTETRVLKIIDNLLDSYKNEDLQPILINQQELDPLLICNEENLTSAIKHIVQNALESCNKKGKVILEMLSENSDQVLLRVKDNGKGMSRQFISERLFQPFDSTKGVSGMGVGVYQSREFLRSIQGDLTVKSKPGEGTTFTFRIPTKDE